jgi:putative membrane protein
MNRSSLLVCLSVIALSSGCSRQETGDSPGAEQQDSTMTDSPMVDDAEATASAVTDSAVNTAGGANTDASFLQNAAEGGMAEVEAGKLAKAKGSNSAVKSFGAMMVKDHSAANEKLQKIAAANGVTLPTQLNAEHQAMKEKLSGLSGKAFDEEYLRGQVKDHEVTVALLRTQIDSGQNADAKEFASQTLPTVEAHLEKVKELAANAGIDAS